MSRTTSPGVVGPSHWAYMATVMTTRLQKLIEDQSIEAAKLPGGVYQRVRNFFDLALQAAGDEVPENPPASLNAYVIAADAVKGSTSPVPATRQELQTRLQDYRHLIERLSAPGRLTTSEKQTAAALQKFFRQLRDAGDLEAYDQRVSFEEPIGISVL